MRPCCERNAGAAVERLMEEEENGKRTDRATGMDEPFRTGLLVNIYMYGTFKVWEVSNIFRSSCGIAINNKCRPLVRWIIVLAV